MENPNSLHISCSKLSFRSSFRKTSMYSGIEQNNSKGKEEIGRQGRQEGRTDDGSKRDVFLVRVCALSIISDDLQAKHPEGGCKLDQASGSTFVLLSLSLNLGLLRAKTPIQPKPRLLCRHSEKPYVGLSLRALPAYRPIYLPIYLPVHLRVESLKHLRSSCCYTPRSSYPRCSLSLSVSALSVFASPFKGDSATVRCLLRTAVSDMSFRSAELEESLTTSRSSPSRVNPLSPLP